MKRFYFKTIFILWFLSLISSIRLYAYDFHVNGIYYKGSGKYVSIVAGDNEYTGKIIIPATVIYEGEERIVTSINTNAFKKCSGLTSITIPPPLSKI